MLLHIYNLSSRSSYIFLVLTKKSMNLTVAVLGLIKPLIQFYPFYERFEVFLFFLITRARKISAYLLIFEFYICFNFSLYLVFNEFLISENFPLSLS